MHTRKEVDYPAAYTLWHRAMLDSIDAAFAGIEASDSTRAHRVKYLATGTIDAITALATAIHASDPDLDGVMAEMLAASGAVLAAACNATRHDAWCDECAIQSTNGLDQYFRQAFQKFVTTKPPTMDG